MLEFDTLNINLGLERVTRVLHELGNPHLKFKTIHVAGTNGKGSVCAMLDSILREAGYKVGLFTSPHFFKWNERIKIQGDDISDRNFQFPISNVQCLGEKLGLKLTPFEIVTCVAFEYFAKKKVDIAVIEVGMGGRLDATNVIAPLVSVITNVDYDHTEYLGKTLKKIAFEKAGIIKPGVPVVTGEVKREVLQVIRRVCKQKKSRLWELGKEAGIGIRSGLLGQYQRENEAIAIKVAELLGIQQKFVKSGLKRTKWPGRFQIVSKKPLIIVDGAHNPAGAKALVESIKALKLKKPLTLIVGFQGYKDTKRIIKILKPIASEMIFTKSSHPQAAEVSHISYLVSHIHFDNVEDAIAKAKTIGNPIVITGSLFLVADALKSLTA